MRLIEVYGVILTENVRNVSGDTSFFWADKKGQDLKPGTELRKYEIASYRKQMEEIFEQVRKEKFPDRPSRLDCIFVFAERYAAEKWGKDVYQVEVTGKVFQTDMQYYTEAHSDLENIERVKDWAKSYWEGEEKVRLGNRQYLETLVDGSVKIVKKVSGTPKKKQRPEKIAAADGNFGKRMRSVFGL